MDIFAFPGDGVPWPAWPSLLGATGRHVHSGGLLGVLHDRLKHAGGNYAASAVFVVEPTLSTSEGFAVFDNLQ